MVGIDVERDRRREFEFYRKRSVFQALQGVSGFVRYLEANGVIAFVELLLILKIFKKQTTLGAV